MGNGLILFFALLSLGLALYVIRSLSTVSTPQKLSDIFDRYRLQIYVDMHPMKKYKRVISLDAPYVGLASGQFQPLVTLMSKLSVGAKSYQDKVLSKDWLVKRICVGGVDISQLPPEQGKALLKASLDLMKFKDLRAECVEGRGGVWNVKGFNDTDHLNSMNVVNIYLSEAPSAQIFVSNVTGNRRENSASFDSQQYFGSRPKVAEVNRAERVAMLLKPVPETLANLIRALQEHIRQREASVSISESQSSPPAVDEIRELPEAVAEVAPNEAESSELPQEVVAEVTTEKGGNICVNKLDSASELLVSIPVIYVFEAMKIMDERKKGGYYTGLDDMKKRLDMDPVRLDQFAEYLCFALPE